MCLKIHRRHCPGFLTFPAVIHKRLDSSKIFPHRGIFWPCCFPGQSLDEFMMNESNIKALVGSDHNFQFYFAPILNHIINHPSTKCCQSTCHRVYNPVTATVKNCNHYLIALIFVLSADMRLVLNPPHSAYIHYS